MTTFALIHGAWHGAWCWERLAAELERRGHRAVAVDLPCDDPAATTPSGPEAAADYTKALRPVMARPTIRVLISRVPS